MKRLRRLLILLTVAGVVLGAGGWYGRRVYRTRQAEADANGAGAALADRRYDLAYERILRATKAQPSRGDWHFQAARIGRQAGFLDEARRHLDSAEAQLGETDAVRFERQLLLVQRGEASELAESLLWKRSQMDAESRTLILEALIRGAIASYRVHHAIKAANAWLEQPTDDARPFYWRGLAYEQLGGYDEDRAIQDFRTALERNPDFDESREHLAGLLLRTKRPLEAIPHYETLRQRNLDRLEPLLGLIRARIEAGQLDGAKLDLEELVRRHPDVSEARRERGILRLAQEDAHGAEEDLRFAVETAPHDAHSLFQLVLCLVRLGKNEEAQRLRGRHSELVSKQNRLRKLLREDYQTRPNDVKLLHEIGVLYLTTGGPEEQLTGLAWLNRLLQIDSKHKPTYAVLADYYEAHGRIDIAARCRRLAR